MNELQYRKKLRKLIQDMRNNNPYPVDVFIEPTKEQYQRLHDCLQNSGLSNDKFFGAFGRRVWDNCLDKIEKELELKEK